VRGFLAKSMATFVQLTEDDHTYDMCEQLAALEFAGKAERKEEKETRMHELRTLVDGQRYSQIIDIFFTDIDIILAADEKDINTLFNLCFSLVASLKAEEARPLAARFIAVLTKDGNFALLKLKLLSTLFNLWVPAERCPIFLSILRFALSSGNASVLDGQFEFLESWIRDWQLAPSHQTELFLLASQVAQANRQQAEYQRFVMLYFKSLQPPLGSAQALESAKPLAASAVRAAIESASSAECDTLLGLAVISQLKDDPKHAAAHELLSIMAHDTVDAYSRFVQENKEAFAQLGFDHHRLLRRMRHFTMCTLGEDNVELSYSFIQEKLQVWLCLRFLFFHRPSSAACQPG